MVWLFGCIVGKLCFLISGASCLEMLKKKILVKSIAKRQRGESSKTKDAGPSLRHLVGLFVLIVRSYCCFGIWFPMISMVCVFVCNLLCGLCVNCFFLCYYFCFLCWKKKLVSFCWQKIKCSLEVVCNVF